MLLKWSLLPAGFALAAAALGQPVSPEVEIANLREDVRGLSQRVSDLGLQVEQLETENGELRDKAKAAEGDYVTVSKLNDTVADINRTIQAAVAASKNDTLQQVGVQMEKLAKETNAALDSLAKGQAARAAPASASAPAFASDFPHEGVTYTVQKGDTIESIAKKTGAKIRDIINANKLADPSLIRVGQALFVPGGK